MSDNSFGIEGLTDDDRQASGSRFAEVRDAAFANRYNVFHVNHPPWRKDRNDPATAKRQRLTEG